MRNWAGNQILTPRHVCSPTSLTDLIDVVRTSDRIGVLGAGHSFTDLVSSAGTLVRLDRWPQRVSIDPIAQVATVSSGMRIGDIAKRLHHAGWALASMPSLPHVTLAGAVATGTHGSGALQPSLVDSVRAVTYIMADGSLRHWSADSDGDEFDGAVVTLGALGVAIEHSISILPTYEVRQVVCTQIEIDEVIENLIEILRGSYSVSIFTDWRSQFANVWLKQRAIDPAWLRPGWRVSDVPVPIVPKGRVDILTQQLGKPGPWFERLSHVRCDSLLAGGTELQSEYLVSIDSAAQAMADLNAHARSFTDALQVSEIRIVRADQRWLSPSFATDSAAFHFTWTADENSARRSIGHVEDLLASRSARPHWGKLFRYSPSDISRLYPRFSDAVRMIRANDLFGKFRSGLVEQLLTVGDHERQ